MHIDTAVLVLAVFFLHAGHQLAQRPAFFGHHVGEQKRVETLDGIKFYLDNSEAKTKPNAAKTWLLLRASGTEPLLRIYSESCSKGSVTKLLEAARDFAMNSRP